MRRGNWVQIRWLTSGACIQHAFAPFIHSSFVLLTQMGMHYFRTETCAERKVQSSGMGYAVTVLML